MQWYLKAAALKHELAMHEIGVMYESGLGVARDFGKAVSWYQKAAEAGSQDAKKRLEILESRSRGNGQPQGESKIPGAILTRCFLEVDVDSLTQNVPADQANRKRDDCLRKEWKRLRGSEPFPLDR